MKSAIVHNLSDQDWVTKTITMAQLESLPLNYEFIDETAKSLYDNSWPARLMTIYLLSENQGPNFKKVLDYTAKYDQNQFVRNLAVALGADNPQ